MWGGMSIHRPKYLSLVAVGVEDFSSMGKGFFEERFEGKGQEKDSIGVSRGEEVKMGTVS